MVLLSPLSLSIRVIRDHSAIGNSQSAMPGSVPPRGSGWVQPLPIADFQLPIRFDAERSIGNRQLSIGNISGQYHRAVAGGVQPQLRNLYTNTGRTISNLHSVRSEMFIDLSRRTYQRRSEERNEPRKMSLTLSSAPPERRMKLFGWRGYKHLTPTG